MARRDYSIGARTTHDCGNCGRSLNGRRRDAIYCGRKCKDFARRHRLERPAPDKTTLVSPGLSPIEAGILLDAAAGMIVLNVPTGQGKSAAHKRAAQQLRRNRKRLEALGLIRLTGRCQRHPVSRITEQGLLLVTRRNAALKRAAGPVIRANRWWGVEQLPSAPDWPVIAWPGHVNGPFLMPSADL
jgi:hypothetical protein